MSFSQAMRNVLSFLQQQSGRMVSYAGNAEIQIIVRARHNIQEDAQNARPRSQRQPVLFSITANFHCTKLFILPGMYAGRKKMYRPTNLPGGCRSDR
jgi:hypothetical protein